jgi:hypothetical protein
LLIGQRDGVPIGVVRFDIQHHQAEVSIYLVPGITGCGRDLLHSAEMRFTENRQEINILHADVLGANERSHHMNNVFKIADRPIGGGHPPFIIAEMSGNHNQSLQRTLDLVEAAAKAGADALKIQTYTPDTMTLDLDEREFHIADPNSLWTGTHFINFTVKLTRGGNGISRFLTGRMHLSLSPSVRRLMARRWIFSKP